MVTLSDISQETGLSVATVSHVLNNRKGYKAATRDKVLKTAQKMGYSVNTMARGLRGQSTKAVGVLWSLGRPDAEGVAREIAVNVWKQGYVTYMADNLRETDQLCEALEEYQRRGVDAVIIELDPVLLKHKKLMRLLNQFKAVVGILVEEVLDEVTAPIDLAVRDTQKVIQAIVDHCVAMGRKKLCFMGQPQENSDKLLPFLSRLRHHGLPTTNTVLDVPNVPRSFDQFAFYYQALNDAVVGRPTFDTLITAADNGAGAASVWLREKGVRVPEDVALFALGDSDLLKVAVPPIAGANRHYDLVADTVTAMLFERLADSNLPSRRVALPMDLIWRESAGPRFAL